MNNFFSSVFLHDLQEKFLHDLQEKLFFKIDEIVILHLFSQHS